MIFLSLMREKYCQSVFETENYPMHKNAVSLSIIVGVVSAIVFTSRIQAEPIPSYTETAGNCAEAADENESKVLATVFDKEIKLGDIYRGWEDSLKKSGTPPGDVVKARREVFARQPRILRESVEVTIRRQLLDKASAGTTVTDAEVDAALEKRRKLFNLTWEQFLEEQKKKGETVEEAKAMIRTGVAHDKWLRAEVLSKFTAATEEELRSIYEKDKDKFGGSFEDSKAAIIKLRDRLMKQELENQILEELAKKANVKTFLPEQKEQK